MSDESSSIWLFTAEEISNSPSRLAGIKSEDEFNYRYLAAQMIQDIGEKLSVFQLCTNTAIVYMHRFYMKQSFHKFKYNTMSAACLFLAAKVEEQPRKIEHVAKVVYNFTHKDQKVPDARSQHEIQDIMEEISCDEQILLQTLGFTTIVEHPHTQIVTTCSLIRASKEISHSSYVFATTSLLLTTMCLQYKSPVISCVCINVACKWSGYEVPKSAEGRYWFTYVDPSMTIERLEELSKELSTAMERNPSKLFKMKKSLSHLKTHIDNEKPKPIIGQPWSGAHLSIQSHSRKPENSSSSTSVPTTTINTSSEVLTSNALYSNKFHIYGANNSNDYVTCANPVTSTASHTTTTTTTVTATTTSVTTATTASYQKVNPHAPKNNNYVSNTTTTTTTTSATVGSHSIPIPARSSSRTSTTTTHAASATTTASAPHNNVNKYVGNFGSSSSSSSSNYSSVRQSHVKTNTSTTTTTSSSSSNNNNSGSSSSSVSGAYHRKNLSDVPAMVASHNNAKNEETNILAGKKNEPNAKPNRQHVTDKVKETPVMNNSLTVSNKESKIQPNASISVKEPQIRNAVANAPAVSIKEPQVRNAVATTAASVSTAAARSPIKLKISGSSLSFSNSLKPPAASSHNDLNSSLQRHHSVATIASTLPPPPPPPQASSSTFTANQSSQEKEPIKIKLNLKAVNQVEERRPPEESNGMKVVLSKSKDGSYIQQSQLQNAGQSARPSANSYVNDPQPPVLSLPPPPPPVQQQQQQHHGHHHKKRKAEHSSSSSSHSSHPRKHLKLDKTSQEQDSNQQPMPQPHHQQQQQRHHQQQQQQQQQPQPRVNIQNNFNAYMSSLPFRK